MNDLESRIRDAFLAREGDAPAFDLSDAHHVAGRTRRRQILNTAVVGVAALAVVVAFIAGFGGLVRADRTPADQQTPAPAGTVGIALPIEYPVGEDLPDLGDAPGPLAAVWMVPRGAGAAPEAVGLVAETGMFGTLPIDVFHDNVSIRSNTQGWAPGDPAPPDEVRVALSADGRRLAYFSPAGELERLAPGGVGLRDPLGVHLGRRHPPLRARCGWERRRWMGMGAGHGAEAGRHLCLRRRVRPVGFLRSGKRSPAVAG
jgi:hypothetical protein